MLFGTLLVAVDGSPQAHRAVIAARELAGLSQGNLVLVYVQEAVGPAGDGLSSGELDPGQQDEVERLLATEIEAAGELGTPVTAKVRRADPSEVASVIVEVALAERADMIAMGSRGLSALSALVVGSNAYKLLHLAHCPVLVVH